MNLTSVFEPDGRIPPRYTCEGRDDSPALRWSDVPDNVKSFVVIVNDPDAPGGTFVHWIVYDLPPEARALPEGVPTRESVAGGGPQGLNDFGGVGYGGPCPPGGPPHRYVFTLSALNTRPGLRPGRRVADVRRAMQGHVLAEAELVGRFQRALWVSRGCAGDARDEPEGGLDEADIGAMAPENYEQQDRRTGRRTPCPKQWSARSVTWSCRS